MGVEGEIRWFSPDPRAILPLEAFRISGTLRQTCRSGKFEIRVNTCFRRVMEACGKRDDGTWITPLILESYCRLHELGIAHSVEAWKEGQLAGGLYGVALGGAFFGESMFHEVRDASKVAMAALVDRMKTRGFVLLDVQYLTAHLERFGAIEIARDVYMERLSEALTSNLRFADGE